MKIIRISRKKTSNICKFYHIKRLYRDIPVITTSYGTSYNLNQSRRGTNPNETHSITKIFNSSGVGIYRLTKKKSGTDNGPLLNNNPDTLNSNAELTSGPAVKIERRSHQTPTQQDSQQKELRETPISFFNAGSSTNNSNNRPGSSHYKGGSAFRRCRILNESPQNFEEYQTPNTGNLELESLNNINNQSSAREPSPSSQIDQKVKQNEIAFAYEPKIGLSMRSQTKQGDKFGNEGGETNLKYFSDPRVLQKINLKTNSSKRGNFVQEEPEYEKQNDTKTSKISTADVKQKAKQVLGGRRYAEDIESLNISDPDDDFKLEGSGNRLGKDQGKIEERANQSVKENFVENFFYGSPHKFNLDQEGEVDHGILSLQRTPVVI